MDVASLVRVYGPRRWVAVFRWAYSCESSVSGEQEPTKKVWNVLEEQITEDKISLLRWLKSMDPFRTFCAAQILC